MRKPATVFVAVLGFGQVGEGETINRSTEKRILCAVGRVREIIKEGKRATLIFTTGGSCKGREATMAVAMEKYARHFYPASCPEIVPIIANKDSPDAWGTVLEATWAFRQAQRFSGCENPDMEFVTNCRHALRIRVTNRYVMKIPNLRTVESDDPPSCWYHEILGYGKLLVYLTGIEGLITRTEKFRRTKYSAG